MRTTFIVAVIVAVAGCSQGGAQESSSNGSTSTAKNDPPPADVPPAAEPKPESGEAKSDPKTVVALTAEQQERLLAARLDGGLGLSFRQFANMFLVSSRLNLGRGIGLMTSDKEIAEAELQSPFPSSYQPTLREFLDAIAAQTFSEWKFDPSGKYIQSDADHGGPIEGLTIFEFTKTDREKPFAITLAEGWKTIDKGNWVMHVPPDFPVGMDIYEMGTYSPAKEAAEPDFFKGIRSAVALEWARRVNEEAKEADLTPAKVGEFDALFFETMVPSQLGQKIKWRQWVFTADNKCYFVVSTILPEFEEKIFPDVQKMLASFRVNKE